MMKDLIFSFRRHFMVALTVVCCSATASGAEDWATVRTIPGTGPVDHVQRDKPDGHSNPDERLKIEDFIAVDTPEWEADLARRTRRGVSIVGELRTYNQPQPPEHWYRVPAKFAGGWRVNDDSTGDIPETISIGSMVDKEGGIWECSRGVSRLHPWDGYIEPETHELFVVGSDNGTAAGEDVFNISHQDLKLMFQTKFGRHLQLQDVSGSIIVVKEYRLLNDHEMRKTLKKISFLDTPPQVATYPPTPLVRVSNFNPDTTVDSADRFREFLLSHKLSHLIPRPAPSGSSH